MIVFALQTWSPNRERGTTKGSRLMWAKRNKEQKQRTIMELLSNPAAQLSDVRHALALGLNIEVVISRGAASVGLDGDNLQKAMKHVRDGIAQVLGVDDADQRLTWKYESFKTKRTDRTPYKVQIQFNREEAWPF